MRSPPPRTPPKPVSLEWFRATFDIQSLHDADHLGTRWPADVCAWRVFHWCGSSPVEAWWLCMCQLVAGVGPSFISSFPFCSFGVPLEHGFGDSCTFWARRCKGSAPRPSAEEPKVQGYSLSPKQRLARTRCSWRPKSRRQRPSHTGNSLFLWLGPPSRPAARGWGGSANPCPPTVGGHGFARLGSTV